MTNEANESSLPEEDGGQYTVDFPLADGRAIAQDVKHEVAPFEVTPCFKASAHHFMLLGAFISLMVMGKQLLFQVYVSANMTSIPPNIMVLLTNGIVYIFAFMAILKLITIFRKTYGHRLVVTGHHVEFIQGIADKKSTKINISHIRAIDIEQTAPDRLIDVGTIRIAASSTEGYEIEAAGINHPERLRDYLKHRIGVLQYGEKPDPDISYL